MYYTKIPGKKNYIDYQPITTSLQIFRILVRIIFYLLCKMEGAYGKLIYPITGLNLLLDTMIKRLMIN